MSKKQVIEQASDLIISGELVVIPTETVYGVGANAFNKEAVAKVFALKHRPTFDPLIVHINSLEMLPELTTSPLPPLAQQLIDKFWPGPLSIVIKKSRKIPDLVTAGLDSVAIRMPSHPLALELIKKAGVPIAAPSANMFGAISATTSQAVKLEFGDQCPFILDGGPCEVGLESTVISFLTSPPSLLRPGGIPSEEIRKVIGEVQVPDDKTQKSLSPGRLESHYAPKTPLYILPEPFEKIKDALPRDQKWEVIRSIPDLTQAASDLFETLRKLDHKGLDFIVAESFPDTGLGFAINDRLKKASGGKLWQRPA